MKLTPQAQLPHSAHPKILDAHLKRLAVIYTLSRDSGGHILTLP